MLKNKIKVSACIITYNHEKYLKDCIEGALMQNLSYDYEIIIGEDKSTDNSLAVCKKYRDKYPEKIKLFERIKNLGLVGNWKETLLNCNGDYIAICEGDDVWKDPDKLQKQVDFLEANPEYILTHSDTQVIDEKGHIIKESKLLDHFKRDISRTELKQGAFLLTPTLCFRNIFQKEILEGLPNVVNVDKLFISLLGVYGNGKGKYIESTPKSCYRVHKGGVWSKTSKIDRLKTKCNTEEKFLAFYNLKGEKGLCQYFRERLKKKTIYLLKYNFKKMFLLKSIKYSYKYLALVLK